MTDFNDLVGSGNLDVFLSAEDINDAGQIAGAGTQNGAQHGFRLIPR